MCDAIVAQLVEQCSCKAPVGGSSPLGGSNILKQREEIIDYNHVDVVAFDTCQCYGESSKK